MTDRKQLEWAAKAVGFEIVSESPQGGFFARLEGEVGSFEWNPHTNSADAFDLLCQLSMEIVRLEDGSVAVYENARSYGRSFMPTDSQHENKSRMRGLIVVTAAAIGKVRSTSNPSQE